MVVSGRRTLVLCLLPLLVALVGEVTGQEADVSAFAFNERISRSARERRIDAFGEWHVNGGAVAGSWRLVEGPTPIDAEPGVWIGSLLVTEYSALERTGLVAHSTSFDPNRTRQIIVRGRLNERDIEFASVGSSDGPAIAFAVAAKGRLAGVKIEGEFTGADGSTGRWSGWWHIWKRYGAGGPTDTDMVPEGQAP